MVSPNGLVFSTPADFSSVNKVYNVTKTVPHTTTITKPVVHSSVVCKTSYTTNYETTCLTTKTPSVCPETKKLPKTST